MQPHDLIDRLYPPTHPARGLLLDHSHAVADFALAASRRLAADVDRDFVRDAALLHDIGIHFTRAPDIGCHGTRPYLQHGLAGADFLRRHGLPRHALVCERHIGVGLSRDEIRRGGLPLPEQDFLPLSLEEQLVTYADLFFSKQAGRPASAASADQVRHKLARFGPDKVAVFDTWLARFGV